MAFNFSIYFFIFFFGLATGSFLNSIIYRLQTGESFLWQRSFCPHCKKTLTWQDLIPLLSFLFLRGKCRYCQGKISWQYPLVEFFTGILFIFIFWNWSFGLDWSLGIEIWDFFNLLYLLIISCFLIIIFVSDLKYYIIPDKIIYPAIGIAFLYRLFEVLKFGNWDFFRIWDLGFGILKPFLTPFFSALLAGAFFFAIVLISKGRWMGWGDPKLAFFMGFFLGFPKIIVGLFLAFLIGAIIGIGLVVLKKKTLKSEVPFGPFLVIGTFIAFFWGQNLINWYLRLLFA